MYAILGKENRVNQWMWPDHSSSDWFLLISAHMRPFFSRMHALLIVTSLWAIIRSRYDIHGLSRKKINNRISCTWDETYEDFLWIRPNALGLLWLLLFPWPKGPNMQTHTASRRRRTRRRRPSARPQRSITQQRLVFFDFHNRTEILLHPKSIR